MAKAKSTKRTSDQGEASPRFAKLGGVMLVAGALSVLGYFVSQSPAAIRKVLSGRSETTLSLDQIEVTPPPPWLDRELSDTIFRTAQVGSRTVDLTDAMLVERIGRAFEANPWVKSAKVVKGSGRLTIELDYRRPVLFIPRKIALGEYDEKGKGCFVDETGAVLPASEAHEQQLRGGLALDNIQLAAIPAAGGKFTDPRIAAAARLANRLVSEKSRLDLVSIVAGESVEGAVSLDVLTRRGSKIHWGQNARLSEAEVSKRLARLSSYVSEFGSLDHPSGPYVFDLTIDGTLKPTPRSQH